MKKLMDERLILSHLELLTAELESNYTLTTQASIILNSMRMLSRIGRRDQHETAFKMLRQYFFEGAAPGTGSNDRIKATG